MSVAPTQVMNAMSGLQSWVGVPLRAERCCAQGPPQGQGFPAPQHQQPDMQQPGMPQLQPQYAQQQLPQQPPMDQQMPQADSAGLVQPTMDEETKQGALLTQPRCWHSIAYAQHHAPLATTDAFASSTAAFFWLLLYVLIEGVLG